MGKKDIIINAAEELIQKLGVYNTSLAKIANKAKISKGTLYYYYSSKDDLIYDITAKHMKSITDDLLHWIDSLDKSLKPSEILTLVFEKLTKIEIRNQLHLYLLHESTSNNKLKEKFYNQYFEWKTLIETGIKSIYKDLDNIHEYCSIIIALFDGFIIQKLIGFNSVPIKKGSEMIEKNIVEEV